MKLIIIDILCKKYDASEENCLDCTILKLSLLASLRYLSQNSIAEHETLKGFNCLSIYLQFKKAPQNRFWNSNAMFREANEYLKAEIKRKSSIDVIDQ